MNTLPARLTLILFFCFLLPAIMGGQENWIKVLGSEGKQHHINTLIANKSPQRLAQMVMVSTTIFSHRGTGSSSLLCGYLIVGEVWSLRETGIIQSGMGK
ncbi:MAG: hypothetical protein MRY86_24395 [Phaeodactylibacter sp.]|nr:hypothetical protein [Phaeodactylibacter sp.]MCI4648623.1 hypothetical protein [Phaeodactylibacter sp.]MCI5094125.1 hypothetical protein [Phaeodactylibacter sp.]